MSEKVAFIGLGVMGYPMAGHLARAGHDVCVFNRGPEKADKWLTEYQGRKAASPAAAAAGAGLVFSCVGADDDLRQVALGPEGALAGMTGGAVFVDHTTTSAGVAREVAAAADKAGLGFLDAPVSGGQAGAETGKLTIMVGGESGAFERARPVMSGYAKRVQFMGAVGAGQLTKMVNQICIAGLVQGLAEGLHFAEAAGLDAKAVLEVISKGAAQSWQMDNRGETMIDGKFDFGFAVDWMRKDLGFCKDEARRLGIPIPVAELVDGLYGEVQEMGGGRWDTSSLIARLRAVS